MKATMKWIEFPSGKRWLCVMGGVSLELSQRRPGGWEVTALGRGWFIEAASLSKAKAKAVNKVRLAIREAAEAWGVSTQAKA